MRENMQILLTYLIILAVFLSIPLFAPLTAAHARARGERPQNWAQPIAVPGLPNLHRVTDNLYRSAQPTAEGMRNAEALGIKTVLSLRAYHGDSRIVRETDLAYRRIAINTWSVAEDEIMEALASIVVNAKDGPFLVHCQHGADRTGLLIAAYRIVIQGWSKDTALDELRNGGYGYHAIWKNIPAFVEKMDVEAWQEKLRDVLPLSEDTAGDFALEAA